LHPPPGTETLGFHARGCLIVPLAHSEQVVFAASLAPVAYWVWAASTHQLNENPFNAIVRDTGFWSLRFLCLTVALTPLRWLTGWHALAKFRRMIGLFAFFYGAIHFAAYLAFDALRDPMVLTLSAMVADAPRPFFALGYLSLVLMVPLAATSTSRMIRRLGGPRWKAVHRLVYPAAIAGVVHTYWPWTTHSPRYAVILAIILAVRVRKYTSTRASTGPRA
jgi:methionine sulfoxide reductase heme-binding subunit